MIEIKGLTKDYGNEKGIFNLNFKVNKGEVFGFLGPNGAGKTTTIRHLMGFINPDVGTCSIGGLDCKKNSDKIQRNLGYLPGEMSFIEDMTGNQFIDFIGRMKEIEDDTRKKELMKLFELDASGRLKKMSKGMKQKVLIICAFMGNPDILILDEPTSGLDPLMQNRFVELILEEKEKGKTILMSSHMFEEVERTCDKVGIIKKGKLMSIETTEQLKATKKKAYIITLDNEENAKLFAKDIKETTKIEKRKVTVNISGDLMPFIHTMNKYEIKNIETVTQSLEEIFMQFYGGGIDVK